jgi:hypothetical protein
MDAPKRYITELKKKIGFYPTWIPQDPVELGAFGIPRNGIFTKEGNLASLSINFTAKAQATFREIVRRHPRHLPRPTGSARRSLRARLGT